jgi:hypothetical protein
MNLQRLLIAAFALALAACGDRTASPEAASRRADAIAKVGIDASKATPGAKVILKTSAKGCKDKAKAQDLIAAGKLDDPSKMIDLWSAGMKDGSCRGFTDGLAVAIDHKEGDLACILPGDDPQNKQCFWVSSGAL